MNAFYKMTLAVALSFVAGFAHATTPSDASLNKLAEMVPYEALFQQAVAAPYEMELDSLAYAVANDEKLTDQQRNEAITTYQTYANNLIKELSTPAKKAELKRAYITAAKQNYSQEEVDALLVFYGNKTLQAALNKDNQTAETYLASLEKTTNETIDRYNKAHRTKTQDAIKRITNQ